MHPTLPSLSGFFDALWSAIDGQALSILSSERTRSTGAFLGAWGECLVWITGKLIKGSHGSRTVTSEEGGQEEGSHDHLTSDPQLSEELPKGTARALISAQFAKLVGELGAALRIDGDTAGARISVVFEKLVVFAPG
jgi:E3 ubiquitin-protein ligase listerin